MTASPEAIEAMSLSALNEDGEPVDWWFLYKVAGKSTTSTGARGPTLAGKKVTGGEYVYFDASAPASAKLALSAATVEQGGALARTVGQLYKASKDVGWFFYNDENPIDGKVNSERGHSKGVLAFDLATNSGVWLVQSTPKFPLKGRYGFPPTGLPNAQTMLCITLADADTALAIARQMYVAQQPNVYLASSVPAALAGKANDARVKLMRDQVASGSTPVHVVVPFRSRGGTKFTAIAKNRTWGLDFYNDLVGPTLHEDLDVETWEHDPVPPSADDDRKHSVLAMKEVDLAPLGIDLAWSEEADHAKLAVSAPGQRAKYVCVGDLNYTIAQRKRSGGTVAFQCEPLWKSLTEVLSKTTALSAAAPAKAAPAKRRTRAQPVQAVPAPPARRARSSAPVPTADRPRVRTSTRTRTRR